MSERIVIVTGVPGSGKTTLVKEALKELKSKGTEYQVVNYGDIMLELMQSRSGVTDRDVMRDVPLKSYVSVQREVARRIARMARLKPVLVDTHCLVKKPEGYYPGLPKWVLEELQPKSIIVVEAKPEEIAGRRTKDMSRSRTRELAVEIDEHQQLSRAAAMAYSALSGASVMIIQNSDKGLKKAVDNIVSALR
ncbi:MAG: adenylate kinase [Methanobacteriota archaeon]